MVLFIFPGLCIYDLALIKRASGKSTFRCWMACVGCGTCFKLCRKTSVYDDVMVPSSDGKELLSDDMDEKGSDDAPKYNSAQKLMLTLSTKLLKIKWFLLAFVVVTFAVCCYFATQLKPPETSEVRLLKPGIQYEQNFIWRKELLSTDLADLSGSRQNLVWGLAAADDGSLSE